MITKALFILSTSALLCSDARASFPAARVYRNQIHVSTKYGDVSSQNGISLKVGDEMTINLKNHAARRVAFLHRHRDVILPTSKSSTHSIGGAEVKKVEMVKSRNSLQSALKIRGGASSSTVQNFMRSILDSSLPEPIKQFIRMICKMIDDFTGFKLLPDEKKKSKARKSKLKEALVEEVSVKRRSSKPRQSKSRKPVDNNARESSIKTTSALSEEETGSDDETVTTVTSNETNDVKTKSAIPATPKPKPKADTASKKFLSNNLKSSNPNYRIQRELKEFISSPPPGLSVKISGKNVRLWVITLTMPENTIYAGEVYKLRVQFPANYPTSPPSVYFLPPTPRHEHVYTNGDICLSLLGKDWRPIMTAQSLAQAIMSILCGAQRKSLPMDNSRHAGNKPGQRQDDWVYHDDNC